MSYILDALRKADAQRERDPARGIHAQSMRAGANDGAGRGTYRSWAWIAGALGVASVAGVGWYALRDTSTARAGPVAMQAARPPLAQPAPAAQVLPPPPVNQQVPVPAPAQQQAKPVAKADIEPRPMDPPRPMVSARAAAQPPAPLAHASPVAQAAPVAQADPAAAPSGPGMAPNPLPGGAAVTTDPAAALPAPTGLPGAAQGPGMQPMVPPVAPRQAAPGTPPAAQAAPTPPVAGLPPDAPKLTITGGVYSTNRAQRMLIVNGQVFREGADLGSGVTLEEIRPKSVYLRFRGARYSAPMP